MADPAVAQLHRWEISGGRWRVLARSADTAVVALLTCDTGEEVDRLTGTGPALLTYLAGRDTSEDETTVHRDRSEDEAAVRAERSADDAAVHRDRDPAGRPRNSRPRDALGRPLAPGAPGIPTMPDDLDVTPAEALQQAQQLLDDGFPFHAHEVLEAAWKAAPDAERELWRGLAQLAVGLTHDRRGNTTGAARLLTRAAERIGPFAGAAPHGIDAAELSAWARAAAADITADRPAPDGRIPRLTTDSAP